MMMVGSSAEKVCRRALVQERGLQRLVWIVASKARPVGASSANLQRQCRSRDRQSLTTAEWSAGIVDPS